jgi:tetratricopeptide (TPR) repeat protein
MKKKYLQCLMISIFCLYQNVVSQSITENSSFDKIYLEELSQENIALKKRIQLFPEKAKIVNSKIASSLKKQDYQLVIEFTKILDSILPNNSDVKNFKGKMYYKLNNPELSLQSFNEAIALDANNKWFYMNKIGVLYEAKRFEEVFLTFNELLRIAPNWAIAYNSKAGILSGFNRNEEAMFCYNRALKIEPKSAQILTNRGDLFHKLGEKEKALSDYKQALIYQSDYKSVAEKIKEISN